MRFDQGDKVRIIGGEYHGEVAVVASEPGTEYGPFLLYRTVGERTVQTTVVVDAPLPEGLKREFPGIQLELVEKGQRPAGRYELAASDLVMDEEPTVDVAAAREALAVAFAKKLITLAEFTAALAELES